MEAHTQADGRKRASPPYIAYQSLKTMAKQMQEHGVPNRVDRSVLTNFSGAVGGQLITALKFLRLTDAFGAPTDDLHLLVKVYGTDDWAEHLQNILWQAYAPIFELDLETASPSQFNERFRSIYEGTEDVSRKCITFFLNAATDANIKVSPYILKNKKPRKTYKIKRGLPANGKNGSTRTRRDKQDDPPPPPPPPPRGEKSPSEILLGLLEPTEMDEKEQQAIWTLLRYFKARGQ